MASTSNALTPSAGVGSGNSARVGEGTTEGGQGSARSRRNLVKCAMDGLTRFKQSYLSVMVLKGGIGLGQVAALTTLLITSQYLPSPQSPYDAQIKPSPTCPRPGLFQAWMVTQIFRLVVCWGLSVWMCYRAILRRRGESRNDEEGVLMEQLTPSDVSLDFASPSVRVGSVAQTSPALTNSESMDSLTSSSGSSSSSPEVLCTPTMTPSSTLSAEEFSKFASPGEGEDDTEEVGYFDRRKKMRRKEEVQADERGDQVPFHVNEIAMSFEDISNGCHLARCDAALQQALSERNEFEMTETEGLQRERQVVTGPCNGRSYGPEGTGRTEDQRTRTRLARKLDQLAPVMSKGLGAISSILFILGNLLLFDSSLAQQTTCYHSSPLLWWGVMTVVGVGYFLLAQVFVVVIIVGIGGQAMLTILRKIGVVSPPPEPTPLRPSQPQPLQPENLHKLPIVCYVPKAGCQASPPLIDSDTEPDRYPKTPTPPDFLNDGQRIGTKEVDESRLPLPPVYLETHRSTCGICQENFRAPKEVKAIMLKVDRLRLLGCDHVFHVDCIDQWLLQGSGNCPYCNRSVRETSRSNVGQDGYTMSTPARPRIRLWRR